MKQTLAAFSKSWRKNAKIFRQRLWRIEGNVYFCKVNSTNMSYTCEMIPLSIGGQLRANSFFIFNKFCEGMFRRETECSHFCASPSFFRFLRPPFSRMGDSFLPFLSFHPSPSRSRARAYTLYSVCKLPSLLHRWGRGVENQGNRGEGKGEGKEWRVELKSKGRKGESGRCEVFFCGWWRQWRQKTGIIV